MGIDGRSFAQQHAATEVFTQRENMIRISKTSPAADARSAAESAGQPPPDWPGSVQACCSACGAPLRSSARFCSDCGAAHAAPAEEEPAANSQFGGSSADLAELLASRGEVFPCPRCDELNKASAAYCKHCGQLLPAPSAPPPAPHRGTRPPAFRYGPEIALMALLGVAAAALWVGRSPTAPASEAIQSVASLSVPTAQPAEPVVSAAPVDPVAPSALPGASGEEQGEASPSVSPPDAAQQRAPVPERARKKVVKPTVQRASAPVAIDEIYHQRAAERCPEGLNGVICRQKLRFELCNKKWTE
jgi:hypothetical protein